MTAAPEAVLAELGRVVEDPVAFSHGVLHSDPWPTAAAIMRAVASKPRVGVKACHASAKTWLAGRLVLWWLVTRPAGKVITTAPTWTQVEKLLWGEIHRAGRQGAVRLPRIHQTELRLSDDNFAVGISTNEGVRFQGWHGDILAIFDEGPGVFAEAWDAMEGVRAGGNVHWLVQGNPLVTAGPYFDVFDKRKAGWERITISAFRTPNFVETVNGPAGPRRQWVTLERLLQMSEAELDDNPRPYLVTRRWVREKHAEWGPGDPLWDSKVLGEFPSQDQFSLFPLAWLAKCRRTLPVAPQTSLDAGVDVAGPGKAETAVRVRQGPNVIARAQWTKQDARGDVVAFLRPFKDRLRSVRVDTIGEGDFFERHLADHGFPTVRVNVGSTEGVDRTRFVNQKAKYYWGLRERVRDGLVGGLTDEDETGQLAGLRYEHDPAGRVKIESKERAATLGKASPDRAESLMLAFADVPDDTPPPVAEYGSGQFFSAR